MRPGRQRKRERTWLALCGLALLAGMALALYPYAPAARLPIQRAAKAHPVLQKLLPASLKAPDLAPPLTGNWLIIPGIGVRERIWEGQSLDVLLTNEGVWHQTGDPSHNLVLAGHRFQYLPPNADTFYNLDKLKDGDPVTLVWDGRPRQYSVEKGFTITPDQVGILDPSATPELTLYTCSDWGATRRLVIVAIPH
jgi:sortase A